MPFSWEAAAYASVFLIALVMRLWNLGDRAVHHDESLHGYFAWQIYNGNGYLHNPLTHGMFHFDAIAGAFFLFGDNDFTLRLSQALFGSGLVLIPWLLRPRLGTVGALAATVMLAFSPVMLYFSRFAREDIFMAVWVLGIVAMMWRYIDEGRNRYLYGAAAMLAFAFATKETAYIAVAIVGVSLLTLGSSDVGRWIWGRMSIKEWKRPAQMLVVVGGLSLPMFAAGIGYLLQQATGMTFTAVEGMPGVAVGAPEKSLYGIATAIILALVIASMAVGILWNRRAWLISGAIFAAIFVMLFSNFLTHMGGVGTGIWQSLGYWVAQHSQKRGDQPWYYYFILVHVYEFLPWLIAVGTVFYYAMKKQGGLFRWTLIAWGLLAVIFAAAFKDNPSVLWTGMGVLLLATVLCMPADNFVKFLVFWAGASFFAFSLAGEKMPWLLVHIALPLIILAARSINGMANAIQWPSAVRARAWLAVPGLTLFILFAYRLTLIDRWRDSFWVLWALLAGLGLLLLGLQALSRSIGWRPALSAVALAAAGLMFVATVRAGFVAAYTNGDVPSEMLVYTQTSPALRELVKEIEQAGMLTGDREKIKVSIDSTSGFTWPWAWYLRGYTDVAYPDYGKPAVMPADGTKIVIIHRNNNAGQALTLSANFTEGRKLPHRWWFPELYKGLSVRQFLRTFRDPRGWDKFVDFFLYRKMPQPFGSEDAYVYFSKRLPLRPFE